MKVPQGRVSNWLTVAAIAALVAGASLAFAQAELGPLASPHGAGPSIALGPGDAETYLHFPIQRLKSVVPALGGIKYDANQEQLPMILKRVAQHIAQVLPQLPDLISREDVYHFQSNADLGAPGGLAASQPWGRRYKYLLLREHNPDGSITTVESRIDGAGKPVRVAGGFTALRGNGFCNQWLFFSADNQPDFHFRYLGTQVKGGRKTYVVAFAQDPKNVLAPAFFEVNNKKVPFYYQGILWVDESTFDIMELRTDLLKPLPQVLLRQLTTELTFRSVAIRGYNAVFWLPSEVDIQSDEGSGPSEESHRYSDYHLFHAQARIIPAP